MKKFILNILILIAVGAVGALVAYWITGAEREKFISRQEAFVEDFYRSLASGQWDEALESSASEKVDGYVVEASGRLWRNCRKRTRR